MLYDHLLKELFSLSHAEALLSLLLGQPVASAALLSTDMALRTPQRYPDLLYRVHLADGSAMPLHIEVQSANEADMPLRMVEYGGILCRQLQALPLQLVLYIGNEPLTMPACLPGPMFTWQYLLADIRSIPAELFLKLPQPHHRILAVLGHTLDMEALVYHLATDLLATGASKAELLRWADGLQILSIIRKFEFQAKEIVEKTMGVYIDITKAPLYQEGREEGLEEGMEKGMEKAQAGIVARLLEKGYTLQQIAEMLELAEEKVRELTAKYRQ